MAQTSENASPHRQFKLVRWFIVASLCMIGLISVISAQALSRYMTSVLLERDMAVSAEFVNSIVRVQNASTYFYGDTFDPKRPEMEEFFRHVASLPDVIRANVYGLDRSILWSSDPELIGQRFDDNDELEMAFRNEVHPELETYQRGAKDEHVGLPQGTTQFVENYLPIWSRDEAVIVGAVELYKSPRELLDSINLAKQYIWIGTVIAGLIVFFGLTFVVRSASRVLAQQEARALEAEKLAVVGEMTSAVAHGIRNPLAAIRSCAEVALDDNLTGETREAISDIVQQSDRLEAWIRSFLMRARTGESSPGVARIGDILSRSFETFAAQMAQRDISWSIDGGERGVIVCAPPEELLQVTNTLVSNAIEAIERDGKILAGIAEINNSKVEITICDTGPGLSQSALDRMFQPFATGKSNGLGVGLSLARRTVERLGGTLEIGNAPTGGARASITFPTYSKAAP